MPSCRRLADQKAALTGLLCFAGGQPGKVPEPGWTTGQHEGIGVGTSLGQPWHAHQLTSAAYRLGDQLAPASKDRTTSGLQIVGAARGVWVQLTPRQQAFASGRTCCAVLGGAPAGPLSVCQGEPHQQEHCDRACTAIPDCHPSSSTALTLAMAALTAAQHPPVHLRRAHPCRGCSPQGPSCRRETSPCWTQSCRRCCAAALTRHLQ